MTLDMLRERTSASTFLHARRGLPIGYLAPVSVVAMDIICKASLALRMDLAHMVLFVSYLRNLHRQILDCLCQGQRHIGQPVNSTLNVLSSRDGANPCRGACQNQITGAQCIKL